MTLLIASAIVAALVALFIYRRYTNPQRAALRARGKTYGWPRWWSTARRRRRLAEIRMGGRLERPTPSPAAIRREAAKRLGLPLDQVSATMPDYRIRVAVFGASAEQRARLQAELSKILPAYLAVDVVDSEEGW